MSNDIPEVTRKGWLSKSKERRGYVDGQKYMIYLDPLSGATVYGPVRIAESKAEDLADFIGGSRMGTRSDFYVGRTENAEWLGSIAFDGYPGGISAHILNARTKEWYKSAVKIFLSERDDATFPEDGWPWPWKDSATSDYAYAFDDGDVWYSVGYPASRWWNRDDGPEPIEKDDNYEQVIAGLQLCTFPNMEHVQNTTYGERSGLIIIAGDPTCWH